jgi:hypothetical protein
MNEQIEFNVENQILTRIDSFMPVKCSKNYLYAKFNFQTDEWKDKEKFAVFTGLGIKPINEHGRHLP